MAKKKSKETVYEDRIIRCRVKIERQFFPKPPITIKDGEFGIVTASVIWYDKDNKYVSPQLHPTFKTITIKGDSLPAIRIDGKTEYTLQACETESDYGISYTVKMMGEVADLSNPQKQRAFLRQILTERQVETLFDAFIDPIQSIKESSKEELKQLKGFGDKAVERLMMKVLSTEDLSEVLVELEHYKLTKREIDCLVMKYKNPRLVVDVVKKNPYILMDVVSRVGFTRADEVALNGNFDRRSPKRVAAYVRYWLEQQSDKGNSWVFTSLLIQAIDDYFSKDRLSDDIISKALKTLIKEKYLWHSEDKQRVGLQHIYDIESGIAKELKRLLASDNHFKYKQWEAKVREQEETQGWRYTDEQYKGIKTVLDNNVVLVQGLAGCVDKDTEFFNGKGWKKISEYEVGDKVLQYNADGTTSLTYPIKYHKNKQAELYEIEAKKGISLCASKDHRIPTIDRKGRVKTYTVEEIMDKQQSLVYGFNNRFITTFKYSGKGIDLTNEQIRVMCAVICDGSFDKNSNSKWCVISLKKERKKERLERLLEEAGIEYKKTEKTTKGYHRYGFYAPVREKEFESYWYNCSSDQLETIGDEILFWDGSETQTTKTFTTTSKKTADFVQFVFTSLGKRVGMIIDDRVGQIHSSNSNNEKEYIRKSVAYRLMINNRSSVGICGEGQNKPTFKKYVPKDGYEYCFSVLSEMFVVRRNNKIMVIFNCGKTSIVAGMLSAFDEEYKVATTALSGRAAVNITEHARKNGSEVEGMTIHRLLKVAGEDGDFAHHERNPLNEDIIILDEVSMVNIELMYSLLKAIKNGAKLIMLGDSGQLPSVGAGNFMTDILNANLIPTVTLTKVHRQAEASGIISESIKIRHGIAPCKSSDEFIEVRGELQDCVMDLHKDSSETFSRTLGHFKEEWSKLDDIMDILVVVPMRERGSASAYHLNNAIQDYLFQRTLKTPYIVNQGQKNEFKVYVGSKIINNKNDYEVVGVNGKEVAIFNGNLGIVQHIDFDNHVLTVDFGDVGIVLLEPRHIKNISLGYAITTHRSQGSGVKTVICALNYESYVMLSQELVYTAITRAKQRCVVVAESAAIRFASTRSALQDKQTFLPELLVDILPTNKFGGF